MVNRILLTMIFCIPIFLLLSLGCERQQRQQADTLSEETPLDLTAEDTLLFTEGDQSSPPIKALIRYSFPDGYKTAYRITTNTKIFQNEDQMQEKISYTIRLRVIKTEDSTIQIEAIIDSVTLHRTFQPADTSIAPEELEYQSSSTPLDSVQTPQLRLYSLSIQHPVILTVDFHGKIIHVDNVKPLLQKFMQPMHPDSLPAEQRSFLIQNIAELLYLQPLQNLFTYYPKSDSALSEWSREYSTPLFEPVIAKNVVTFKVQKVDEQRQEARILMKATAELSPLQFQNQNETVSIDPTYQYRGNGSAIIDLATGLPKRKSYTLSVKLPLVIKSANGQTQKLTQQYQLRTTIIQLPS